MAIFNKSSTIVEKEGAVGSLYAQVVPVDSTWRGEIPGQGMWQKASQNGVDDSKPQLIGNRRDRCCRPAVDGDKCFRFKLSQRSVDVASATTFLWQLLFSGVPLCSRLAQGLGSL